jgi:hypothetical protein
MQAGEARKLGRVWMEYRASNTKGRKEIDSFLSFFDFTGGRGLYLKAVAYLI